MSGAGPHGARKAAAEGGSTHCTAKLYLEGRAFLDHGASLSPPVPLGTLAAASGEPSAKRSRTAAECVRELQDLKELLDAGLLSSAEWGGLKARVLSGE